MINTAADNAQVGAQIGHATFPINVPRAVRVAIVVLIVSVLAAGATWATVTWVLPQFDPTYKTEFLIDAAVADTGGTDDITKSLRTVVENSGDSDALGLRTFGGECGDEDNTTQLVDFGTDNRQDVIQGAAGVRNGGKATLQRGIVEAVEDFSKPFARRAKQVNRIIVVSRHGVDACDTDMAFVEKQVRDRVAAAGLAIEFRMIGYQVPGDQRDPFSRLAAGAGAPEPLFVDTPQNLDAAMDWFTNVEPVLRNAKQIVDILNPTVEQVNTAVTHIVDGRLDVAERILDKARVELAATDTEFEDLQSRAKTPAAQSIHSSAARLRTHQRRVVEAATDLFNTARGGSPLASNFDSFKKIADDYNTEVKTMNQALATLRAQFPTVPR